MGNNTDSKSLPVVTGIDLASGRDETVMCDPYTGDGWFIRDGRIHRFWDAVEAEKWRRHWNQHYECHPRAVEAVHEVIDERPVVDIQWRKP